DDGARMPAESGEVGVGERSSRNEPQYRAGQVDPPPPTRRPLLLARVCESSLVDPHVGPRQVATAGRIEVPNFRVDRDVRTDGEAFRADACRRDGDARPAGKPVGRSCESESEG